MPRITCILYDGGFKDSAPALQSLKHQTIIDDIQVIWIEYGKILYPQVKKFNFVEPIVLGRKDSFDASVCYNIGLDKAEGDYFMLVDPCLWFSPDTIEHIVNYHKNNKEIFTYNWEIRGKNKKNRFLLTKKYMENVSSLKADFKKIKKTNRGCMSCTKTEYFKGVNGFDVLHPPVTNGLTLCLIRIINKYKINVVGLEKKIYHPFHPRGKKADKERMKNLVNKFKSEIKIEAIR